MRWTFLLLSAALCLSPLLAYLAVSGLAVSGLAVSGEYRSAILLASCLLPLLAPALFVRHLARLRRFHAARELKLENRARKLRQTLHEHEREREHEREQAASRQPEEPGHSSHVDKLVAYHGRRILEATLARPGEPPSPGQRDLAKASSRLDLLLNYKVGNLQDGSHTIGVLELVDELLTVAAPLLDQYSIEVHPLILGDPSSEVNCSLNLTRQVLLAFLLDTLLPGRVEGESKLSVLLEIAVDDGRLSFRAAGQPDLKPSQHLLFLMERIEATWTDGILRFPARTRGVPVDRNQADRFATIVTDNADERDSLEQRLSLLGIFTAHSPADQQVEFCFVSDERSQAFLSIKPQLPPRALVCLLRDQQAQPAGQIYSHKNWASLQSPVTQQALRQLLAHRPAAGEHKKLLFVDDNRIHLKLMSQQATELGCDVTVAESGEAALALAATTPFDLVFMDMQLPGIGGLETTRLLREQGVTCPVTGLTAYIGAEERSACIDAGMRELLIKPVRLNTLRKVIHDPGQHHDRQAPLREASGGEPPVFDPDLAIANASGRPELAGELMREFVTCLDEDRQALDAASGDPAQLKREAHKLQGALRYCGLPRLQRAVEALDATLRRGGDPGRIDDLVRLVHGEMAAVEAWYRDNPGLSALRSPDGPGHRSTGKPVQTKEER